ncbi:MAG: ABC transporter permease [Bryobacterales bacterium]|nr:ABC transporter permease [Bryobacterales bacterium]
MNIALQCSLGLLLAIHVLAGLAGYLAPYEPEEQHRQYPWHPPLALRWDRGIAVEDPQSGRRVAVRWFTGGTRGWKLFQAEAPGQVFLFGTDGLGRDQFSRLLHGARVSLFSGLAAAGLAAILGLWLGGMAGFYGGLPDRVVMNASELFLVLPWMYLLLAARAFFPLNSDPRLIFTVLLLVLGVIGWARPARVVRGIVMSAKERDYVLAARGFRAGSAYLLARHVLPPALPAVLTSFCVAIPQYVAAEATLSFLGLGFSGSAPSWGVLIASLASLEVIHNYWWMWIPALALALVMACYSVVAHGLTAAGGYGQ